MDFMSAAQLLGNIGEFVGAILLFVSLIYIGVQIRQNTRATAAEVYQSRALGAQDYFLHQAADPELADIFLRIEQEGADEIDKLTDNQRRRYTAWHLAGLARLDNSYYQFTHGFLDPEYYEAVLVPVIKNVAPIWLSLGLGIRPSFREEIQRIIDSSEGADIAY
jgi:hypothetical protein